MFLRPCPAFVQNAGHFHGELKKSFQPQITNSGISMFERLGMIDVFAVLNLHCCQVSLQKISA